MNFFTQLVNSTKVMITFIGSDIPEVFIPKGRGAFLFSLFFNKKKNKDVSSKSFSSTLTKLGPSYIKLGQFLATRPDIIGLNSAEELSILQDEVPAFPREEAEKIISDEFGLPVKDLFIEFDNVVTAASIAQEIDVAVKVLRPGIEDKFNRDFQVFYFISGLLEKFNPSLKRLKFAESIETLEKSVDLEMDLRLEAAAISEMTDNLIDSDEFILPNVFWDKTSKKVLTTEWIEGVSVGNKQALIDKGYDLSSIARIIIQSFLTQALRHGFFHADMHPGNLFINNDGKLVMVDFGIMGRLGNKEQNFLAEILWGLINRDYKRTAEVHFEAGYVSDKSRIDEFSQALRSIGEPLTGRNASEISMARVLAQLFDVTEQFNMKTRPELLLLQKTMVVTEGVARSLDPNLNMWDISKPIVSDWMSNRLSPAEKFKDTMNSVSGLGNMISQIPNIIDKAEKTTTDIISILDKTAENKNKRDFKIYEYIILIISALIVLTILT
jgi:ubiquinone biosynthesis protein